METNADVVLRLHVEIGEPMLVEDTGGGVLTIIPIAGGTFTGKGLSGRVLPGGADWNLRLPDGSAHLHARYWIETGDGAVIAVDNEGIASSHVQEEGVSTIPRFTCDRHGKYAWLMDGDFAACVSGCGATAVDVVVRRRERHETILFGSATHMILSARECESKLRWTGRTLYDETRGALFFNWTCAGFTLRFRGKRLEMDALAFAERYPGEGDNLPWLAVFFDGGTEHTRKFSLREGENSVLLFESSVEAEHTLRLVKLSEGSKGRAGLRSLRLTGELLPLAEEKERRKIEFVGDSITCGFGDEMAPEETVFSSERENGLLAYGAVASALLDAEYHCVCVSGIPLCWARDENYRIVLPWVPEFETSVRTMEGYYEFADRQHEEAEGKTDNFTRWDFTRFVPDAVVINLGTNDAFRIRVSGNDPEEALHFQARYAEFLERVRARNGEKAWLVCTLGTMDYFLYDNIEKAAAEYRAKTGDARVVCFKFGAIDPWGEGFGGLEHPNWKTQARMGRELAAFLAALI